MVVSTHVNQPTEAFVFDSGAASSPIAKPKPGPPAGRGVLPHADYKRSRVDLHWLDSLPHVEEVLFSELPDDALTLATGMLQCKDGFRLLRFLAAHPGLTMTAADYAYFVGGSEPAIQRGLAVLMEQEIVQAVASGGDTFYRLAETQPGLDQLAAVCAWHSRWIDRIQRLGASLGTPESYNALIVK
jgi:hypothetical protein